MKTNDKTALQRLYKRWLLGSDVPPALTDYPQDWQVLLHGLAPQATAPTALGIFSHYQALTQQAQPSSALMPAELLPPPVLPLLPRELLPLFRQILQRYRSYYLPLLQLLASRGYSVSPEEQQPVTIPFACMWQLPAAYQDLSAISSAQAPVIDADNWATFLPGEQIAAVRALRRENPQACAALLMQCLGQEKAGQRLKIVEALAQENLSAQDVPWLQSLQQDRSKKLTAKVTQLLAQITPQPNAALNTAAVALAQTLRQEKSRIRPRDDSTQAVNRRQKLWAQVSFSALAEALGISRYALLSGWDFRHNDGSEILAKRAAEALPATEIRAFFHQYPASNLLLTPTDGATQGSIWQILLPLWRKLPLPEQQQLLARLLQQPQAANGMSDVILYLSTAPLPASVLDFAELSAGGVWQHLLDSEQAEFARQCCLLGFLLPAGVAKQAVAALAQASGLFPYDPVFDCLNLNSRLTAHQTAEATEMTA